MSAWKRASYIQSLISVDFDLIYKLAIQLHQTFEKWQSMNVQRHSEARSRNRCCRGKAISFTFVCVLRGCTVAGICLRVCNLNYPACNAHAPDCHLQPLWLHHIFRHYVIYGTILGNKLLNIKCVFWFSIQFVFEIFLILRTHRNSVINLNTSSCRVLVILIGFKWNFNFLDIFSKKSWNIKFHDIRLAGAELFHADGRTDRYDEANSRFSQFCERA